MKGARKNPKRKPPRKKGRLTQKRSSESFRDRVHAVVRDIPRGSVRTYKEVAEQAGSPQAQRAVGAILSKNFDPSIPCHRVVRSDGTLGKYNRGDDKKKLLLKQEGALS